MTTLLAGETRYETPAGARITTKDDGSLELNGNPVLVNGSPIATLIFTGAWSSLVAYSVGNIVTYLGNAYVAIQAGINHIPASSPTFWTPIVSGGALVPPGGTTGQVLTKNSSTDGDTGWADKLAAIGAMTILANLTGGSAEPTGTSLAALAAALGLAAIATSGSGADLVAASVSNAALALMNANTVKANLTGGPAAPTDTTLATLIAAFGLAAIATSGSGADLVTASVTLGKIAVQATATFLGNISGGNASPSALTATQVTAALNLFSSSLQGLVGASGGGTVNFLRADGSWAAPPGVGGGPLIGYQSADVSFTSNTTLANLTGLFVPVAALHVYRFDLTIFDISLSALARPKIGFAVPAGTTMAWNPDAVDAPATIASNEALGVLVSPPAGTLSESQTFGWASALSNPGSLTKFHGLIFVGATPGNVQVQGAQNSSNGNQLTFLTSGSMLATLLV